MELPCLHGGREEVQKKRDMMQLWLVAGGLVTPVGCYRWRRLFIAGHPNTQRCCPRQPHSRCHGFPFPPSFSLLRYLLVSHAICECIPPRLGSITPLTTGMRIQLNSQPSTYIRDSAVEYVGLHYHNVCITYFPRHFLCLAFKPSVSHQAETVATRLHICPKSELHEPRHEYSRPYGQRYDPQVMRRSERRYNGCVPHAVSFARPSKTPDRVHEPLAARWQDTVETASSSANFFTHRRQYGGWFSACWSKQPCCAFRFGPGSFESSVPRSTEATPKLPELLLQACCRRSGDINSS